MIPFNKPYMTGKELSYIDQAYQTGILAGNGRFTQQCHSLIQASTGSPKVLLTHSCTAALEMSALLTGISSGDEVILPSFTFVSTANAFVLRGGTPVFVDIRPDTLNIDTLEIEKALSPRTKAIVPVHYAGVGCDLDAIMDFANQHDLFVIEDAAQGYMSRRCGKSLGSVGHLGAISFHETKNVISGEGGALLINDERFARRSEIIWEKGTNRREFFRGEVDKYSWVDVGSSFLPGEVIAAFLLAQLEEAATITEKRLLIWAEYHQGLEELENKGLLRRPVIPDDCDHNAHMYYLLLEDQSTRKALIKFLGDSGISSVFHYTPLHSSPAGLKYGRFCGDLSVTDSVSEKLLRLPLFQELEDTQKIIDCINDFYRHG